MRVLTKTTIYALMLLLIAGSLVTVVNIVPVAVAKEIPYGGKLTIAYLDDARTRNIPHPDYQYTCTGCRVWPAIYDRPWVYYEVVDSVATPKPPVKLFFTDWEVSEDGLVWTAYLAQNATFHDGEPVTAEDVKWTADNLIKMSTWEYAAVGLNRTEVVDDYTVKFYMNFPRAYPPMDWTPILPKHIWEPYEDDLLAFPNEEMIGSGWFKLKEWKRDEYWWFEVNENYWKGRAYLDELVFKIYPSMEAAILALKAGEVDAFGHSGGVSTAAARELMGDPNINVPVAPGSSIYWISVNVWENKTDPLARDVRVRRAIAHAIDTDTIINTLFLGYAEKVDSWIYPELSSHNPNLPQYEYNVTKANEILDDAGYLDTDGDGVRNWEGGELRFELFTFVMPTYVRMAEVIKESLEEIGVAITVKTLEEASLFDVLYRPDESLYDLGLMDEEPGILPEWMWEFALSYEPGKWNQAGWTSEEFDDLYYAQAAEVNTTKRDKIWWDMAALIDEDLPYTYLIRPNVLQPHRTDKFEGFVPTMGGISVWFNSWSLYKTHLKEAAPPPAPTPSPLPWIIAGVCIVVAIGSLAYAVTRRPRKPSG